MEFIVEGISTPKPKEKVRPCSMHGMMQDRTIRNYPVDTDPNYINPDAFSLLGYPYGRKLMMEDIIMFIKQIVQKETGLEWYEIIDKTRKREIVSARHLAIYLIKEHTNMKLTAIGSIFGKDHATVLHSYKTWKGWAETDRNISSVTDKVNFQIKEFLTNREDYKQLPTSGDVIGDWNKVKYKYLNFK